MQKLGLCCLRVGKLEKALKYFEQLLAIDSKDIIALAGKGEYYLRKNNIKEAISYLNMANSLNPNDPLILAHLGECYRQIGEIEKALIFIQDALKLDPSNSYALAYLGILQLTVSKNIKQAFCSFSQAIDSDSFNGIAWSYLGICYLANHTTQGVDTCLKAIQIDPSNGMAWHAMIEFYRRFKRGLLSKDSSPSPSSLEEIEAKYKECIKTHSSTSCSFVSQAAYCLENGLIEEAKKSLDKALMLDSSNCYAWTFLANYHLEINQLEEALKCINHVLELDPFNLFVLGSRGEYFFRKGHFSKALNDLKLSFEHYFYDGKIKEDLIKCQLLTGPSNLAFPFLDACLESHPQNTFLLSYKGILYLQRGQIDEALLIFNLCINRDPQNLFLYAYRGLAYLQMKREKEALNDFISAVKINSQQEAAWYGLCSYYSRQSISQEIIGKLNQLVESDPLNAFPLALRCMFYFEQNHQLETIEPALKKGLELDKNNPLIHFCYGLFYKKQNNLTQAVKCLENSCKFYLFNDQAWVELAECYQELKNFDEALKCYEKALDLNALNRRALIFKGIYCFEKREMTDAENTFKKASSLDPTDLVPFIYLGKQSLFSSGPSHCQSAALYFKSAIKMNMNSEMAWIGLIECYLREKSSEHAIAELNEWVVENPKHPYPLAFRAVYYLERGQLNNAFLDLKQAKTLCSTKQSPVVYALLAGYYIKEEEIEKASQAIEQAKELSSTHDLVLLYQGLLHLQKNQFQEAIACLKIVGKRYPEHALCFALIANCYHALTDNEHELKILYLEKALNLNPFNSYALNLKAFISLEDGELAQAREAANLIIQMNCNDHLTYACLGECCRQEDELDQALKFFDRSIELNSCFEFSWTRILLCYRKMDLKTKLSQSYFELKTKSYPTNPYAWTARALYFFKNGNIELAEKDYQQALALKSVSPFILDCYIEFVSRVKKPADVISHLCKLSESMHLPIFSLSRLMELLAVDTVLLNKVAIGEIAAQQTFINALKALIHLNNDQVYSAEKCIKKIERSAPKSVNALTIRGLYELKIGDSRKAKSLLNEAHNLDPREPFIIALLGKCLMKLSQNSLSMQYFNRALWLDPTVLSIWFIKADFYFNAGDFIKAAYCYKQMIHLQPNQESFYFHYGECLFKQENFSGALIIFGQLTDLDSQKRQVECLFNLKNYAEAERKIRQILKQNITNSSLLALLGACLFELNELQEAKNTILSVLLIDNKNQLANLYLKKMGAKSAENEVLGVGV